MVDVEEERVIAGTDVKNAALGADCQLEKYLSNSKVEPDNGLSTSELKVSGGDTNGGTSDHELDNTIEHVNNNPDNSESLHNEQESNIDASDNKQQVDSDAPLNNPSVESETYTSTNEVITEAMTENELASSTIDPNNQFSHSHNHHFADFHMIREDQLPQPKSLPNGDPLPSSEPIHLANSQIMHHYELENNETLHENQLVESQEHYGIVK